MFKFSYKAALKGIEVIEINEEKLGETGVIFVYFGERESHQLSSVTQPNLFIISI